MITELFKRHIYTTVTSASICSCLKYLGYILKDEENLFLLVFLLTKTWTVVGEVWIQMTKRIKRQIKEVNFSDLNDISHLASKNFQVLQAALCLPWRGKKTQTPPHTLSIARDKKTCPMFMGSNPIYECGCTFTGPNTSKLLNK